MCGNHCLKNSLFRTLAVGVNGGGDGGISTKFWLLLGEGFMSGRAVMVYSDSSKEICLIMDHDINRNDVISSS